jgi:hypothetical protein
MKTGAKLGPGAKPHFYLIERRGKPRRTSGGIAETRKFEANVDE